MKRTTPPLLAALLVAACAGNTDDAPGAGDRLADDENWRVVARVNGAPILARQVDELFEADLARKRGRGEDPDGEDLADLRRNALELLIRAELLDQAAQRSGIEVPQAVIDEQVATIRSQFPDEEAFESYLQEAGLTVEGIEEDARRRARMTAYAVTVTPDLDTNLETAARRLYEDQQTDFRESDQVRAARIIVRFLPGDPPERREAARKKIDDAKRRLDAGEDFGAVARELSESPFAARGGDMGWFRRGRTLPEFEEEVFSLPVGEVSDVFETRHGLNIVKVLDRREGRQRGFDEVRTNLLMVLVRAQGDRTLRAHVDELRREADVEILE